MSIVTKTGDKGWTGLLFERRVRKDDLRVEAYGTLDELNSFMGYAKTFIRAGKIKRLIHECQRDIFIVASEMAVVPRDAPKLEFRVDKRRVERIEKAIGELEAKLKLKECCFLIPGENKPSALLDVCRTITRRAERMAWGLQRKGLLKNPQVPVYLNRLSDLLYLLARREERKHVKFVAGK